MTIGWFSCAPTASSVRFLQFISIGYINLYLLGKKFFLSFTHLCLLVIYNNFARPVLLSWYIPKVQWPFWAGNQVRHFENARCAAFVSTGKRPFFFLSLSPPFCTAAAGKCRNKRWAWSDIFDSLWVCFLRFSRLFFFFCVVCCRECSEPYLDVSSDFSCAMLIKEIKFDYDKDWSRTDVCRWTCVLGMRREKSSF